MSVVIRHSLETVTSKQWPPDYTLRSQSSQSSQSYQLWVETKTKTKIREIVQPSVPSGERWAFQSMWNIRKTSEIQPFCVAKLEIRWPWEKLSCYSSIIWAATNAQSFLNGQPVLQWTENITSFWMWIRLRTIQRWKMCINVPSISKNATIHEDYYAPVIIVVERTTNILTQ